MTELQQIKAMLVQVLRNQITDNESILEMPKNLTNRLRRSQHELRIAQSQCLLNSIDPELTEAEK